MMVHLEVNYLYHVLMNLDGDKTNSWMKAQDINNLIIYVNNVVNEETKLL